MCDTTPVHLTFPPGENLPILHAVRLLHGARTGTYHTKYPPQLLRRKNYSFPEPTTNHSLSIRWTHTLNSLYPTSTGALAPFPHVRPASSKKPYFSPCLFLFTLVFHHSVNRRLSSIPPQSTRTAICSQSKIITSVSIVR